MAVPMRVLLLTAVGPILLASTLMTVMALALLPPILGLAGFVTGIGLLSALAVGLLEEFWLRTFGGARAATEGERAVLAPVRVSLASAGVQVPEPYIDRVPRSAQPAALVGRHSLIVSRELVEATYRGQLSREEAAALVAHEVGRGRARSGRCELAVRAWGAPCRVVVALAGRLGAPAARVPPVRAAWRLRFVVAIVCVVQSAFEGRTVSGLIAAGFIA